MAWKTEKWLDEVFPGKAKICADYRNLPPRELVIVASAVLDAALAELLHKRFRDLPREAESFLGVNGDGRAPAASFGARIQLALLIGLLTQEDADVLRGIKNLRNTFAHRVQAQFIEEPALAQSKTLLERWRRMNNKLIQAGVLADRTEGLDEIERHLESHSGAGEGLVLALLSTYQAYLHLLETHVGRIEIVRRENS